MEISGNDEIFTRPLIIVLVLCVLISYIFIMFIIYFLLEEKNHKKYPLKLRWIWFLMWFGITGNRISTEAHKIYNEYIEKENEKDER